MPLTAFPYLYSVTTSGAGGTFGTFDYPSGVAHLITPGPKLHDFSIVPRVELAVVDLFACPSYSLTVIGAMCTGQDHRVYFATGDGNHLIMGYNPSLSDFDKQLVNLSLPQANYLAAFTNGHQYVVGCGGGGSPGGQVYMADMSAAPVIVNSFFVNEHNSFGASNARACNNGSNAVVVALDTSTNALIGIYVFTDTTVTRTGGLTAAAVDGSAVFTIGLSQPCIDHTDGNILLCVQTALGPYLIKIQTSSGAMLWKLAIHAMVDLNESQVNHGMLQFITPGTTPWQFYTVDTVAGTLTVTPEGVLPSIGLPNGWSDDTAHVLISAQFSGPGQSNWATFGPVGFEDAAKLDGLIEVGGQASSEVTAKIDAFALASAGAHATMVTPKIDAFVLMAVQLDTTKIDALVLAGGAPTAATMIAPKIDAFMLVQAAPGVQHEFLFVDEWIGAAGPGPPDLVS